MTDDQFTFDLDAPAPRPVNRALIPAVAEGQGLRIGQKAHPILTAMDCQLALHALYAVVTKDEEVQAPIQLFVSTAPGMVIVSLARDSALRRQDGEPVGAAQHTFERFMSDFLQHTTQAERKDGKGPEGRPYVGAYFPTAQALSATISKAVAALPAAQRDEFEERYAAALHARDKKLEH
ncbi:MAG: hypothetical protein WDN72_06350 [Alphaproteobacteria bacterium]